MKNKLIISLVVLTLIIFVGFFVFYQNKKSDAQESEESIIVRDFEVDAFRFGYSPDLIEVNQNEIVRIKINNLDTTHGILIPALNVRGNEFVEFSANRAGEFRWRCNVFCGQGHSAMGGKIIVK